MNGLCVSNGYAKGHAVIVDDLFDNKNIAPNTILVMKYLDRKLLVNLSKNVIGVVAELGNIGSHGAGILRHLKIPCVLRIKNAVTTFQDGDLVEINGSQSSVIKCNLETDKSIVETILSTGSYYSTISTNHFDLKDIRINTEWYCPRPDRGYQTLRYDIVREVYGKSASFLFGLSEGEVSQNPIGAITSKGAPNNLDLCRFVLKNPSWLVEKAHERDSLITAIKEELTKIDTNDGDIWHYWSVFQTGVALYRKLFLYSLMSQAISDEILDAYVDFVGFILHAPYSKDVLSLRSIYVERCLQSGIDPGVSQRWKEEKAKPHIWDGYIDYSRLDEDESIIQNINKLSNAEQLSADYESFRTIVPLVYQLSEEFFYTSSSINSYINWSLVGIRNYLNLHASGKKYEIEDIYDMRIEELLSIIKEEVTMKSDYSFMAAFNPEKNLVKEFEYWVVLLREGQNTLGDCIIVPKRQIPTFGDMMPDESAELSIVIKWYEQKCREVFGAQKYNYIAAMMRDNFAHFHAFPRYSADVEKYGHIWKDERWPRVIQFGPAEVTRQLLDLILSDLRE